MYRCILFVVCIGCAAPAPSLVVEGSMAPVRPCSPPHYVGAELGTDIVAPMEQAVLYWNDALDYQVFIWAGETPFTRENDLFGALTLIYYEDPKGMGNMLGQTALMVGECGCLVLSQIRVSADLLETPPVLGTVVRHELGHLLGLADVPDDDGQLMFEAMGGGIHPRGASTSELIAVRKNLGL